MLHRAFDALEILALGNVLVVVSLDFVLRDIVIAHGAQLVAADNDFAEFAGNKIIVLRRGPGPEKWVLRRRFWGDASKQHCRQGQNRNGTRNVL